MAISFRHDAAAVALPSNQSQRKYGQSLVLQEQKRKYDAQQQGYDRLFTLGRDQMQNNWQAARDNMQQVAQMGRDAQQNDFLMGRQDAQNKFLTEQQKREQAAADFSAARGRMDNHAKDALKNPDLPPELRQKIQNLVNGKLAAMGSGFNETQQQQFLDQYNSQLAALLSEVPAAKPAPTPDQEFQQGVATDPETGMRYRKNSKGDWEELKQQPKPATSAAEAFQADPRVQKEYMERAIAIESKGGELDEAVYNRAVETASRLWERSHSPTAQPPLPGAASTGGIQPATIPPAASPGTERSILEKPRVIHLAPKLPGAAAMELDNIQSAERSILEQSPVAPPDQGVPPSTTMPVGPSVPGAAYHGDPGFSKEFPAGAMENPDPGFSRAAPTPEQERASFLRKEGMDWDGAQKPDPAVVADFLKKEGMATDGPKPNVDPKLLLQGVAPQGGITLESASMAAKQYEGAAQALQGLQAKVATLDQKIQATSGSRIASNNPDVLVNLKKQREQVNAELKKTQSAMQEADKSVRSYHDQQVAQQPAAQKLAKAGKRPQDFAEAEFQLQNLRKQYPNMASMPAEAKKKLKEAMAIIQAGR